MTIRFGTTGWRAVNAKEFPFAGMRAVTEAICTHFNEEKVDQLAEARGLPGYETSVGYIGELINEDESILGGEESAGSSIKGHYPEKDGIPACLLAAEAVAARGKSLAQQFGRAVIDAPVRHRE